MPSTKRVYRTGQQRYLEFCRAGGLPAFPLGEDRLCTLVAHLVDGGLQHSSIKGYLSAIRHLLIVNGMGDPFATAMPLLEYALRGVKVRQSRSMSTGRRRCLPITPDILRKLKSVWERTGGDVNHIMLWAACCTCFYGFLRSGEATVPSTKEYDREGQLSEGGVAIDSRSNPTVVRVHIKASKTDPFRQGVFIYLGKTGNDLCPVVEITAYLAVRGRVPGPFFRFRTGAPLSRELLVKYVRQALGQLGFEVSSFAGHSFRIGAATTAAAAGLEDSIVHTNTNSVHCTLSPRGAPRGRSE